MDLHPHDVFLQIWIEFGLAGALVAATLLGLALWKIGKMPDNLRPPRLALLASVVAIGLVELSAWQPWWIATIATAQIWLAQLRVRLDA